MAQIETTKGAIRGPTLRETTPFSQSNRRSITSTSPNARTLDRKDISVFTQSISATAGSTTGSTSYNQFLRPNTREVGKREREISIIQLPFLSLLFFRVYETTPLGKQACEKKPLTPNQWVGGRNLHIFSTRTDLKARYSVKKLFSQWFLFLSYAIEQYFNDLWLRHRG
jgi:hypothetical protein